MKELVEKIIETMDYFKTESGKRLKGNTTAGRRARKATLELEKLMKEYRKESMKEDE